MSISLIDGGVCAAKGFVASGIHCGIRASQTKKDLALILSDRPAVAAATYTTNLVKGAPLEITRQHIASGPVRALICNSGNANTCNADGPEVAAKTCELTAQELGIAAQEVLVASTGVIGQPLDIAPIQKGLPQLVAALSEDGSFAAAEAIMTTDTKEKEVAVEFQVGDITCHLGGISKGSGMIHPNMATMLAFLTTDCAISQEVLAQALSSVVANSFNMISVDGDTSTNDMVVAMANGAAGNDEIAGAGEAYDSFLEALLWVCTQLARKMAADGEGASHLLTCLVKGAANDDVARTVAKSVICSSLVKAAIFGADANWGRVLCAIGYSGADVDVTKVDVAFSSLAGSVVVCRQGAGIPFSEEEAKKVLLEHEVVIAIDLNAGSFQATAWGCDLTYEYVKINGDYRT